MTTTTLNGVGTRHQQPNSILSRLRERITSSVYSEGEWLPTERDLTQELNVHRSVVRAAIAQLEVEGLLIRRPNCRPVVCAPQLADVPDSVSQFAPSRLVALVMYHGGDLELGNSAQQRIFWGMNQALARAGYHALFLDLGEKVGTQEQNAASEAAHLRYVVDQGFGGVIFYSYAYNKNRELIREVSKRLPLVLIDRIIPGIESDFVGLQNYQLMYEATEYLVKLGHRRIAYVTRSEPINAVQDRLAGHLAAMQHIPDGDGYEMVLSAPSYSENWPIFDTVFRLPVSERPTAALCVNDYEAVRVHERLSRMNISVPEDVSVVGCDNIVEKLPSGPGLTTVAQPFEEIGREAVRLFLRRLAEPNCSPASIELPADLIVRESATVA